MFIDMPFIISLLSFYNSVDPIGLWMLNTVSWKRTIITITLYYIAIFLTYLTSDTLFKRMLDIWPNVSHFLISQRLPSISCSLLTEGQADIVGPGVQGYHIFRRLSQGFRNFNSPNVCYATGYCHCGWHFDNPFFPSHEQNNARCTGFHCDLAISRWTTGILSSFRRIHSSLSHLSSWILHCVRESFPARRITLYCIGTISQCRWLPPCWDPQRISGHWAPFCQRYQKIRTMYNSRIGSQSTI